ncbi:type VI secretion system baseplate subunit TssE [Trinickia fusca]|uniref:Type VI secretion system baseplate subunit TssE n=1 Tax=Trinickia fusca TaxID=2419777 RepID=A0A494X1P7_9BURK|nr:type VI secretion system baseplate subunit TssE [Trinickia fusca]RKP44637.1 type VI secretion system baseplate subunit TssE [Trinickia fusca]
MSTATYGTGKGNGTSTGSARGEARRVRERLQPALLDRLTDAAPQSRSELDSSQWIDAARLREAVLRDLAWLLNTTCALDTSNEAHYPEAARSVVNYGIAPLAGSCMSEIDPVQLEETLKQAIVRFEPRLLPASVDVRYVDEAAQGGRYNVLTFEIAGTLWCAPYPLPILVRTDLDLESGVASLRPLGER